MALKGEQLAQLVYEATSAHARIADAASFRHWHFLTGDEKRSYSKIVEYAKAHSSDGPASVWNYMREFATGDDKNREFDQLPLNDQYRVFLLRAIVASQTGWE
jgi:hypothetical protein